MTGPIDVLVRAVDAGDTYLSWRWLDDSAHPDFVVVPASRVDQANDLLAPALLSPLHSRESRDDAVIRALSSGPFAALDTERVLSAALTDAVFPPRLRAQFADRARGGARLRLRLTPSPRLALIPWELLFLDADRRLLEVAEVVYEPPAAVHADRPRLPEAWDVVDARPALFVIDPGPSIAADGRSGHVLDRADRLPFADRLVGYAARGRVLAAERAGSLGRARTRHALRTALATPRSRLFYLGHVSADPADPGSAALHLADPAETWGTAAPSLDHRPLAALDLFLGTLTAPEQVWSEYGSTKPQPGHELWPMPSRVALIVCEGNADYRAAEVFGLVVAMVHGGAALVTTTRWVLPTDRSCRSVLGAPHIRPTTELALRVDAAHETPDPIADLTAWQRECVRAWCDGAAEDAHGSPLVWASLTHTIADRRPAAHTVP